MLPVRRTSAAVSGSNVERPLSCASGDEGGRGRAGQSQAFAILKPGGLLEVLHLEILTSYHMFYQTLGALSRSNLAFKTMRRFLVCFYKHDFCPFWNELPFTEFTSLH